MVACARSSRNAACLRPAHSSTPACPAPAYNLVPPGPPRHLLTPPSLPSPPPLSPPPHHSPHPPAAQVTLTPLEGDHNYVPAMWGTNACALKSECPVEARTPTGATAVADATAATIAADIAAAINTHVYGTTAGAGATASVNTFPDLPSSGTVDLARTTGGLIWKYAVTESTKAATATELTCSGAATTICKTDLAVSCSAGAYGIIAGSYKICSLCPAGTYGDGVTCTACAAGTASASVGADAVGDCAACDAGGVYAEPGSSDCLLCPAGTYKGVGDSGADCAPW